MTMAAYEYKLTLYMTLEAENADDAEAQAERHKDRLVGNGLAADLGYWGVAYSVKPTTQTGE